MKTDTVEVTNETFISRFLRSNRILYSSVLWVNERITSLIEFLIKIADGIKGITSVLNQTLEK